MTSKHKPKKCSELTEEVFELIALVLRSRGPVRTAVRIVLVDGKPNPIAISITGVSAASLSNSLTRYRRTDAKIKKAYKVLAIYP
jgi:hypothetical protein